MNYNELCKTEIYFYNVKEMQDYLLNLDDKNLAVIISDDGIKRWKLGELENKLNNKYNIVWLKYNGSNPTPIDILNSIEFIKSTKITSIIAIGGGSIIDLAKAISAFHYIKPINIEIIKDSIKNKSYLNNKDFINIIAIPTTAGTGSEVTKWATIWDNDSISKYSIDVEQLTPKIAIIVPELTITLPNIITLSTGLDALSHAIEAYWNKYTSDVVQEISIIAINKIVNNLKLVIDNPQNIKYRIEMSEGSLIAGIAFSKTCTTACHAISYPITQMFNIPHGIAVSMTLEKVAQINKGHFKNDERLFSIFNKFGGIQEWIDYVNENLVSFTLKKENVSKEDVKYIVEKSFENNRINNNPVNITKEDILNILYSLIK